MTGDSASSGALTVELAGQRRTLSQADMLTFGRAADLVIDDDNPYLHRVVGRFFCHEGNWWLENLGSFIEIEVVPVGEGATTRLTPHQPEGAPSAQSLPARGFTLRFESNDVSYEINGRMEPDGLPGAAPASPVGVPDPEAGPPPAPEGSAPFGATPGPPSPFSPPQEPAAAPAPAAAPPPSPGPSLSDLPFSGAPPFSDAPSDAPFGASPPPAGGGPAPSGPPAGFGASAPAGASGGSPGEPTLSADERQLLSLLAEPYWRDRGAGAAALPSDADLATLLGWPEPRVGRTIAYLCNRLTRGGVAGLHDRGRRFGLVRHVVETGLITGADVI